MNELKILEVITPNAMELLADDDATNLIEVVLNRPLTDWEQCCFADYSGVEIDGDRLVFNAPDASMVPAIIAGLPGEAEKLQSEFESRAQRKLDETKAALDRLDAPIRIRARDRG